MVRVDYFRLEVLLLFLFFLLLVLCQFLCRGGRLQLVQPDAALRVSQGVLGNAPVLAHVLLAKVPDGERGVQLVLRVVALGGLESVRVEHHGVLVDGPVGYGLGGGLDVALKLDGGAQRGANKLLGDPHHRDDWKEENGSRLVRIGRKMK